MLLVSEVNQNVGQLDRSVVLGKFVCGLEVDLKDN